MKAVSLIGNFKVDDYPVFGPCFTPLLYWNLRRQSKQVLLNAIKYPFNSDVCELIYSHKIVTGID